MRLLGAALTFLLLPIALYAQSPTICLNMIVKNEVEAIERCLNSVKPYIDYWVIVDTGSSDGTQDKIRTTLKDIPGELHQRKWIDFSHNRNQALTLARPHADYVLFIDADETLDVDPSFDRHSLCNDLYIAFSHQGEGKFTRVLLAKTALQSQWEGVLHEVFQSNEVKSHTLLDNVSIISTWNDGFRSRQGNKYDEDAAILEKALLDEPNNERYVFYLAQCYNASGKYQKALELYQKRVTMDSSEKSEVFYSQFQVGKLQKLLNYDTDIFIHSLTQAFLIDPTRVEPIYEMALYYLETHQDILAYILAEYGKEVIAQNSQNHPPVVVHLHNWIYVWGMELLFGDAAARLNKTEEAIASYSQVLEVNGLPKELQSHLQQVLAKGN